MGKPWAGQYMAIPGGPHFKGTCLQKPTMLARGKASTTPGMVANVVAKEGTAMVVMVAAGTPTAEEPKFFRQSLAISRDQTSLFLVVFFVKSLGESGR